MKGVLISFITFLLLIGGASMSMAENWDKTFPKSNKVNIEKVHFKNRYGIKLTGDLYIPKSMPEDKLAAIAISGPFGAVKEQVSGRYAQTLAEIAISGPFGAVKEQVSGRYAQTLAERGFVTLAFDPSYTGESGGEPRDVASPDINTEDFSAAVDYLSNLKFVNPDRIGILGICGFGGFGLNAAAIDTRIKATVTVTMYDMTRVTAKGYFDSMDENARYELKEKLNKQRTEDFKNGTYAKSQGLPDKLTGDEPQFVKDYVAFYKTKRGFHKRSIGSNGGWNTTSSLSLINMPILAFSDEIRNPVLMIHGEKAHSRYFSEAAFKKLKGSNKELYIVPDNLEKIPFDKIEAFYKEYLK